MTKEQFIKYMGIIHKRYDTLEMLYDDLEKFTGVVCDRIINDTSIEPMVDMLAEWVGDTDDWISWYVYDKDFGENTALYCKDKNGNVIPSDTLEDLWELIKGGD